MNKNSEDLIDMQILLSLGVSDPVINGVKWGPYK